MKHKKIYILLMFFLMFLFFTCFSSVKAAEPYDDILESNEVFKTIYNKCKNSWNTTGFILCKSNKNGSSYVVYRFDTARITATFNNGVLHYYFKGDSKYNNSYFDAEGNFLFQEDEWPGAGATRDFSSTVDDYCYSRLIVYDESGNVVNPWTPPQEITETLVEATTKAQIMVQLKIMIVGFLKYLIVLVISLIAFWKGWQFLSTQLRKA